MPDEAIDEVFPVYEHVWQCPGCKAVMPDGEAICDYCEE